MGIVSVVMRFIFYSLLVLNVVYFGWKVLESLGHFNQVVPTSFAQPMNESRQITLLSEKNILVPVKTQAKPREKMSLCSAIGPFPNQQRAQTFLKSLNKGGYSGKIQKVVVQKDSIHWVYLPAYSDMEQALQKLAELQAQKIDSYVVTDGEYKYGISLGYFSSKESATGLRSKLLAGGLPARIAEQQRQDVELWVSIDPKSEKKDEGLLIEALVQKLKYQKREQALCDFP